MCDVCRTFFFKKTQGYGSLLPTVTDKEQTSLQKKLFLVRSYFSIKLKKTGHDPVTRLSTGGRGSVCELDFHQMVPSAVVRLSPSDF